MNRLLALSLLAFFVALSPARAQEAPTDTTDLPPVVADSAATDSAAVIQPDPERARELYDEGRALLRAQDYEGALSKYDQALLYNNSYAVASLGRAMALAQLGRLEDSRNAFESAIAMAEASDASNAADVVTAARRGLEQVTAVMEARAANEQQQAAASAAQAVQEKVTQATQMLAGNEISYEQGAEAYALLEQARMGGYDPNLVAYYYAKALLAMERAADAIPYAETAVAQNQGQDDRSSFYILLGQAHLGAGNAAEARAAFEAIEEGEAWHGWVPHYLGLVAELEAEG